MRVRASFGVSADRKPNALVSGMVRNAPDSDGHGLSINYAIAMHCYSTIIRHKKKEKRKPSYCLELIGGTKLYRVTGTFSIGCWLGNALQSLKGSRGQKYPSRSKVYIWYVRSIYTNQNWSLKERCLKRVIYSPTLGHNIDFQDRAFKAAFLN